MQDADRYNLDVALDSISNILRVNKLDNEAKFGYFKALKGHPIESIVDGIDKVIQSYKPHGKDNFPAPAVIIESITGVVNSRPDDTRSRTYDEIRESYLRRGILIGEEATERLENEIKANYAE